MSDLGELVGPLLLGVDDPYPAYDVIRAGGPVQWVASLGRWLVTGHREALAVLVDSRASADRRAYQPPPAPGEYRPGGLPFVNPPEHTRLRNAVAPAFTARAVAGLRPRVTEVVARLLDEAAAGAELDLIGEFAGPLAVTVLAGVLGIPGEHHELFRGWATKVIETIDPVSLRAVSPDGDRARLEMTAYLGEVVAARRARPADDLISTMVHTGDGAARLSAAELLEMCLLLTIVGIETTTNLIGNGVSALLAHPAVCDRLRARPDLITTAVEELARYDAPVQIAGRVAAADIELAGKLLRPGQEIAVVLGAANRDPAAFPDPATLDLARTPNNHVAFGRGIHFCLGAPIARLESAVAIAALVARFPRLRPAGVAKRRPNVHVRGFESIPLALA